jgi:hypothetical protein
VLQLVTPWKQLYEVHFRKSIPSQKNISQKYNNFR